MSLPVVLLSSLGASLFVLAKGIERYRRKLAPPTEIIQVNQPDRWALAKKMKLKRPHPCASLPHYRCNADEARLLRLIHEAMPECYVRLDVPLRRIVKTTAAPNKLRGQALLDAIKEGNEKVFELGNWEAILSAETAHFLVLNKQHQCVAALRFEYPGLWRMDDDYWFARAILEDAGIHYVSVDASSFPAAETLKKMIMVTEDRVS